MPETDAPDGTQRLIRLEKDAFAPGVTPSVPDLAGAPLADAQNLVWDELSLQPMPGQETFFAKPLTEPVMGLGSTRRSKIPTLFTAYQTHIYSWTEAGGSVEAYNALTGGITDLVQFCSWGEWMLATNNVDGILIDKGSGFGGLSGTPPATAKLLRKLKTFVLALNTSNDPNEVVWCDDDDPEDWVPTIDNYADSFIMRNMDSEIMAAEYMADFLAVYGRNSMRGIRFVGFPDVMSQFDIIPEGIGCWGPNAVCRAMGHHFGWGPKGLWATDGTSYQYLENPAIRDVVQNRVNLDYAELICVTPLAPFRVVLFFFPEIGKDYNSACMAYNWETKSFWPWNLGRTVALPENEFNSMFFGFRQGDVYRIGLTHEAPGEDTTGIALSPSAFLRDGFGKLSMGVLGFGGELEING